MTLRAAPFRAVFMRAGAALSICLAWWGLAFAHAVVVESSPREGARLTSPPREIVLRFNARIEKSLTRLTLAAHDGKVVKLPALPQGKAGEAADEILVIPLPPLAPGSYSLRYKIFATDGHATLGILRFSVAGGP